MAQAVPAWCAGLIDITRHALLGCKNNYHFRIDIQTRIQRPRLGPHPAPVAAPVQETVINTTADSSRRALLRAALAAPALAAAGRAAAQGLAAAPIHVVVPFPAGGSSDTLGRLVAAALAAQLKQSVIVENKGGAGGNIAADYVFRAQPDGHTLLVAGQAILAINEALYDHISYRPEAFEYLGMLGQNANVILANTASLSVHDLAGLIEQAKARPGAISFGSNGVGSLSHLTAEVLASAAHVRFLHVPYQGAAPMATDLRAGRLNFCVTGSTLATSLMQGSDTLRALAVTTGVRIPQLPDTPTLRELGYPQLDAPSWWALMATPGTPEATLAQLRTALAAAVGAPQFIQALAKQSTLPYRLDPHDAPAFLANERAKWAAAVKSSGAKLS
ncbi:MAG TPA: tripartite tricarboxylate transporter substrate binding protein [Bordetella sp.]